MFKCWYCGEVKPRTAFRTAEHIIPASFGGTLALSTHDVCDACQSYTGRFVDAPLARCWFAEAGRLRQRVSRSRHVPVMNYGTVAFERPERFEMFGTNGAEKVIRVTATRDGEDRAYLLASLDDAEQARARRVAKQRLPRHRVIAPWIPEDFRCEYDHELVKVLIETPQPWKCTFPFNHRDLGLGFVKMALGLACHFLGTPFVGSAAAHVLRRYLQAAHLDADSRPPVHGSAGLVNDCDAGISDCWQIPDGQNAVALLLTDGQIVFHARFFGSLGATVLLGPSAEHRATFPVTDNADGFLWILDPGTKTVTGPVRIFERLGALAVERKQRERATRSGHLPGDRSSLG